MKARRLIDGASFGPDALKAIVQAFDKAWAEIAGNFGNEPTVIAHSGDLDQPFQRIASSEARGS
jgi:hypothetical protein